MNTLQNILVILGTNVEQGEMLRTRITTLAGLGVGETFFVFLKTFSSLTMS